jgi:chromosome segregation ATPase
VEEIRRRQEVRVTTRTVDGTLADTRRHIGELEARATNGAPWTRARVQNRLDRLREEEGSARKAVHAKAELVDEQLRQLEIDITIADSRLASELADDATSFADAVQAELDGWDAAIERLQMRAAAKSQQAREQAEAEIASLRQLRNRAAERLSALPASPQAWGEQKNRVTDGLDDLERHVREAAVKIKEEET